MHIRHYAHSSKHEKRVIKAVNMKKKRKTELGKKQQLRHHVRVNNNKITGLNGNILN